MSMQASESPNVACRHSKRMTTPCPGHRPLRLKILRRQGNDAVLAVGRLDVAMLVFGGVSQAEISVAHGQSRFDARLLRARLFLQTNSTLRACGQGRPISGWCENHSKGARIKNLRRKTIAWHTKSPHNGLFAHRKVTKANAHATAEHCEIVEE